MNPLFENVFETLFEFVILLNIDTEYCEFFRGTQNGHIRRERNYPYIEALNYICNHQVEESKQGEFLFQFGVERMIRQMKDNGGNGHYYFKEKKKDGSTSYKLGTFSYLSNQPDTICIFFRDVDEVYRAQLKEEDEMQNRIESLILNNKKSMEGRLSFARYVVKEMEMPLVEMSELIKDHSIRPEYRPFEPYVRSLMDLKDWLDRYFSHEEVAQEDLDPLHIGEIVKKVCEEEQLLASNWDIKIELRSYLDKSEKYYLSAFHAKQILENLLGNSMKYSPNGGTIHMMVREIREEEDSAMIQLELKDNGPIVNEYYWEREPAEGDYNVGEKLAFLAGRPQSISEAMRIVDYLGGSYSFQKNIDFENMIYINLPLKRVSDTDYQLLGGDFDVEDEMVDLSEYDIAYVGMDANRIQNNKRLLESTNAYYRYFAGDRDLMEYLNTNPDKRPLAILSEKTYKGGNCLDLAKIVTGVYGGQYPVIEVLDKGQTENASKAFMSGVNYVLHMPFKPSKLKGVLQSLSKENEIDGNEFGREENRTG